jgi:hypothetical protein
MLLVAEDGDARDFVPNSTHDGISELGSRKISWLAELRLSYSPELDSVRSQSNSYSRLGRKV